jgi:alcohol dehydrogenase (cytochrome c)
MKALISIVLCASLEAQVPSGRILHADAEPGNWLTYSGDLGGKRYSPLTEINRKNISHLNVKWAHQFANGSNEVSPIVTDGVMYVTGPNTAVALDARTGRDLWDWSRPIPPDYRPVGFGQTSRGPAVLDDKLFVATLDGWLVALDLKSGAERWSKRVLDYKLGYSMTMAPLAIEGKAVVGVSGGEAGIRGFIDAYDATSGKRAWRFWTIPGPDEPGHETWAGDSWKTGGGSTWVTGAYDPELKLVYWGVGNPGPDWNGDSRGGDNLYTCSLVALDAGTSNFRICRATHTRREKYCSR